MEDIKVEDKIDLIVNFKRDRNDTCHVCGHYDILHKTNCKGEISPTYNCCKCYVRMHSSIDELIKDGVHVVRCYVCNEYGIYGKVYYDNLSQLQRVCKRCFIEELEDYYEPFNVKPAKQ
jgi:hypothetical protein